MNTRNSDCKVLGIILCRKLFCWKTLLFTKNREQVVYFLVHRDALHLRNSTRAPADCYYSKDSLPMQ